jgi:hypothetical protein
VASPRHLLITDRRRCTLTIDPVSTKKWHKIKQANGSRRTQATLARRVRAHRKFHGCT